MQEGNFPNPILKRTDGNPALYPNGKIVYLCCCGCDKKVTYAKGGEPKKFFSGHNRRGSTQSSSARLKVSVAKQGINPKTGEAAIRTPIEFFQTEELCTCNPFCTEPLVTSHYYSSVGELIKKKVAWGHNRQGQLSDEIRANISKGHKGEESRLSPYFFSKGEQRFIRLQSNGRWATTARKPDGNVRNMSHARAVLQDYFGIFLPRHIDAHHRDGILSIEHEIPENLLAVHWRWNSRYFLMFMAAFNLSILEVTKAYETCAKNYTRDELFDFEPPVKLFADLLRHLAKTVQCKEEGDLLHYDPNPDGEKLNDLNRRVKQFIEPDHSYVAESPYVPGLFIRYSDEQQRWCFGESGKALLHSRAVHNFFYNSPPEGYHVHHRSGQHSNLLDDHPRNLLAVPAIWNTIFFPNLARGLLIAEKNVTEVYESLVAEIPSGLLFNEVAINLLDVLDKGGLERKNILDYGRSGKYGKSPIED